MSSDVEERSVISESKEEFSWAASKGSITGRTAKTEMKHLKERDNVRL